MFQEGDIRKGLEIGYKCNHKYIYHACIECGKLRWVAFNVKKQKPRTFKCLSCPKKLNTGHNNPHWKGGKWKNKSDGYIYCTVKLDDFYHSMAGKNNTIPEHRLVMAKYMKRCLLPWEVVHHKNGIRDDNRIENLQLLPSKKHHLVDTLIKSRLRVLEKRITILEAENTMLKQQLELHPRTEIEIEALR